MPEETRLEPYEGSKHWPMIRKDLTQIKYKLSEGFYEILVNNETKISFKVSSDGKLYELTMHMLTLHKRKE